MDIICDCLIDYSSSALVPAMPAIECAGLIPRYKTLRAAITLAASRGTGYGRAQKRLSTPSEIMQIQLAPEKSHGVCSQQTLHFASVK
jgi:hypothetical protein